MDLINAGRFMENIADGKPIGSLSQVFNDGVALNGGGIFGMEIGGLITKLIGVPGLFILSFLLLFVFIMLLVNTPLSRFFEDIKLRRQRRALEKEERAKERQLEMADRYDKMQQELNNPNPQKDDNLTDGQRKIMGYMS